MVNNSAGDTAGTSGLRRIGTPISARPGLLVEPTAATAGAALTRLLRDGTIRADQSTVVVLTGHGLKAADRIGELLGIGSAR